MDLNDKSEPVPENRLLSEEEKEKLVLFLKTASEVQKELSIIISIAQSDINFLGRVLEDCPITQGQLDIISDFLFRREEVLKGSIPKRRKA